ncbi:hypothetical protein [Streptomyces monashensis]|uniref:hypothetical protein n=1 Tax=Streptomyces monashensis TaxID=1678012 RepID=UPI003F53E9E2
MGFVLQDESAPAELTAAPTARTEPDGHPRAERTDLPTRTLAALRTRFDGEIPG